MYTPDDLVPSLQPFVDGQVWTARAPLRFYGVPMGTRMTVCRLGDGRLLVHSPIRLEGLTDALRALGEVAFVVAPSFLHHLYVGPCLEAFPQARLFVSRKLVAKRPDLRPEGVLGDEPPAGTWGDTLDQATVRSGSVVDEVVFLHRAARTLIVCDLLECVHADAPLPWRMLGRIGGIYERHAPPLDMRLSFTHRAALRGFVTRVLEWDFDRIVLSHGNLVERDGKRVFRDAYAFCLSARATDSPGT